MTDVNDAVAIKPTGGGKRPIDTIHEQNERWRQNGGRLNLTTPNDLKPIKLTSAELDRLINLAKYTLAKSCDQWGADKELETIIMKLCTMREVSPT